MGYGVLRRHGGVQRRAYEPSRQEVVTLAKTKFWSRVGHWISGSGRSEEREAMDQQAGPLAPRSSGHVEVESGSAAPLAEQASAAVSRLKFTRSSPNPDRLEEEHARVATLIDAMQRHLSSQAESSEALARWQDELVQSLSQVPETSRKHLELLTAISDAVSLNAAGAKRVEESLVQLPQLADAQRETMVSIAGQLDLSRQTTERVAGAIEGFQQVLIKLGETSEMSTRTLQHMRLDAAAGEERVAELLEQQSKRLVVFAWSALGLCVVAAVLGLVALFRA